MTADKLDKLDPDKVRQDMKAVERDEFNPDKVRHHGA